MLLLQAHGGPPLVRRGSAVMLRGLQSRQELNGRTGRTLGYDQAKARYQVELEAATEREAEAEAGAGAGAGARADAGAGAEAEGAPSGWARSTCPPSPSASA